LIEHVVNTGPAHNIGSRSVTVLVGHQTEQVKSLVAPLGVRFVEQIEQKGTDML